ncbi:MAG: hypothetical protein ACE5OQ_14920 [Woeseia sp.]
MTAKSDNNAPNEQQTLPDVPEAPEGMKRADTDVDDYPAWEFDKGSLTGVVLKVKTVELIRRGEPVDVRLAIVEEVGGERWSLWESANLVDFFDKIGAGVEIAITQRGEAKLSGNRVMKLYDAFYSA